MKYSCRLYKLYDLDILGILDMGYALGPLFAEAVTAYAHGEVVRFAIPEPEFLDSNDIKSYMLHIHIPDSDEQTNNLLHSIKFRQRNAFFKAVFRNALITQHTSAFFSNPNLIEFEKRQLTDIHLLSLPNVKELDDTYMRKRVITVLDKEIAVQPKMHTNGASEGVKKKVEELKPTHPQVVMPEESSNFDELEEIFI